LPPRLFALDRRHQTPARAARRTHRRDDQPARLRGKATAVTNPPRQHQRMAAFPVMAKKGKASTHRKIGRVHWLNEVAEHDYVAAENYLSIRYDRATVASAVKKLRAAPLDTRRANDILRAAGLEAAPLDDPGVMRDLVKVVDGDPLSPVLVVNGRNCA